MQTKNLGSCKCGKVELTLFLPEKLENYSPRVCDCDFCVQNNLIYLSDSRGKLEIKHNEDFKIIKQGSEQAKFLSCNYCGDIIAATYQFSSSLKGAINSNLLDDAKKLLDPTWVSPKKLAPQEKLIRWEELWLDISLNGKNSL